MTTGSTSLTLTTGSGETDIYTALPKRSVTLMSPCYCFSAGVVASPVHCIARSLVRSATGEGVLRKFIRHFHHWFEYNQQIEAFQAAFPKVRTYSYERAVEAGLIKTFFDIIGFPMPPNSDQIWERKTPDTMIKHVTLEKGLLQRPKDASQFDYRDLVEPLVRLLRLPDRL